MIYFYAKTTPIDLCKPLLAEEVYKYLKKFIERFKKISILELGAALNDRDIIFVCDEPSLQELKEKYDLKKIHILMIRVPLETKYYYNNEKGEFLNPELIPVGQKAFYNGIFQTKKRKFLPGSIELLIRVQVIKCLYFLDLQRIVKRKESG